MPSFPGRESILKAAGEWKTRCLIEDGSVLDPGEALWTLGYLDDLMTHFVQNPLLGKDHFMVKLKEQLDPVSPHGKKLAAEMLWVMMLFPVNFNRETKLEKVRTVWEWSGAPLPESKLLKGPLDRGIGSVGPGFINHQPFELKYLIERVVALKRMAQEERGSILDEPDRLSRFLDVGEEEGSRQLPHMLAHLLDPPNFEDISSTGVKLRVLQGFDVEVDSSASLADIDGELRALRARLREEYPDREHLTFFRPPLIDRWDPTEVESPQFIEEHLDHARRVFEAHFSDLAPFAAGGDYEEGERGYKVVMSDRARELFETIPADDEISESDGSAVVEGLVRLFSNTLRPYPLSQNLINWRYTAFLREMEPGEAVQFTYALRGLKDDDVPAPSRVTRFLEDVWPILERHDAASNALSRSFPSLLLWLLYPDEEFFIRTEMLNRMSERLTGERLFLNKRLDRGEYEKARVFARAVREKLESWEWAPRDMIDVQSFLWTVDSGWESKPENGEYSYGEVNAPKTEYGGDKTIELGDVMAHLESEGLHFPPTLVANYILALQTKRLVILTGISGTGKTQLAKQVGEFYSQAAEAPPAEDGPDPVCILPVRPDWTDGRGLLGYHNPITDEYVETPFLQLLRAAAEEEDHARRQQRTPRPYFAVLDEMNLARVEHYFSDFLSVLESDGVLHLHSRTTMEKAGDSGDPVPGSLPVPRNVFFTGTVNVDETTHMFSPKVLDRAFTLELNEVDLDGWATSEAGASTLDADLQLARMDRELRLGARPNQESWEALGTFGEGELREVVAALHRELEPHQHHFGYRVAAEIAAFVLHAQRQGAPEQGLWTALDLAVLEKVLPKFHGTDQELAEPLEAVAFVARWGRGRSRDERERGPGDAAADKPGDARLPRSLAKVERMRVRLRARGYASFLE